ncbi:MAG: amidohydrolase family protein [Vicinamibacteria bacterium]
MKLDAHVHFWRYDPGEYGWIDGALAPIARDFLPDDLAPLAAATGIDGVVAVQARQSLDETEFLLDLTERHPLVRGVVGWIDLQADDGAAQAARFRGRPLVGVRHVVQDEPDDAFLLRPAFVRGIAALEDLGLAYDLLIRPRQLPAATELVSRFPRQRFVLDHLAKPDIAHDGLAAWEPGLRRLADQPNVLAKLSGLVTEADWSGWTPDTLRPYLDVAWDAFGPDRLMLGSDWPVCTVAGAYERVVGTVAAYVSGRPAREREAVLGDNAARFWNLRTEEPAP